MDLLFGCCGASDAATPGRRCKQQPLATAAEKPTVRSSSSATVMAEAANQTQHVVVMRHGDRLDHAKPAWFLKAERPWDPPLADHGRARAAEVGRRLRDDLGFPIHRIVASPFLRCVETATEVVSALCAVDADSCETDSPVFQVSIEYGLCEVFNRSAIRTTPKKGKWGFDTSELHRLQSLRVAFPTVKPVTDKLPNWEESVMDARTRYKHVIQALADKYPSENLLLVTHAEALKSAVLDYKKDVTVTEVECCAFVELQRPVSHGNGSFAAGDFELVTASDHSGISYLPLSSIADDLVK